MKDVQHHSPFPATQVARNVVPILIIGVAIECRRWHDGIIRFPSIKMATVGIDGRQQAGKWKPEPVSDRRQDVLGLGDYVVVRQCPMVAIDGTDWSICGVRLLT